MKHGVNMEVFTFASVEVIALNWEEGYFIADRRKQ